MANKLGFRRVARNQYSILNLSPADRKERSQQTQLRRYRRRREFLDSLKIDPCKDCAGNYPPCALDFDHLPGVEKLFTVARWPSLHFSKEILLEEISKCELICANCHRIRTSARVVLLPVRLDLGHRPSHCINGHLLSGDNVYVTPKGARQCRICKKVHKKAFIERRKS